MATLARLSPYDRRAVTIETGIQNSGLGLVLIFGFFGGLSGRGLGNRLGRCGRFCFRLLLRLSGRFAFRFGSRLRFRRVGGWLCSPPGSSQGCCHLCCVPHTDDTHTHRVIGRGVDLAANDRPDVSLDCGTQCHTDHSHDDAEIDKHGRLACQTCHIPEFAREDATDMFRDWSNLHFDEEKGKYMYHQELEYDVEPVYAWYNGDRFALQPGQPVRRTSDGKVAMILPEGDRDDPEAKIAPFKLHRGRLPVLKKEQWLAPLTTEELYVHGDPEQLLRHDIRCLRFQRRSECKSAGPVHYEQ